jgi:two-component system aerobic respiration control sensor histidine kinase ArcB
MFTSKKLAKKCIELEGENARLRNLILNIPGCVYWKNTQGVYLGCNQLFVEMVGLSSSEEVIGKTDNDFCWKDSADELRDNDIEVMKSKRTKVLEEVVTLASGEQMTYTVMKAPLKDAQGKIIGVIGTSLDITQKQLLLSHAKEKAELANQAKQEFLSNMRHDIRTALSGVVGFAEILKMKLTGSNLKKYAENLVASSRALHQLLDEVLEAVKVSSGEIPKLKKKFSLVQLFQHLEALYLARAHEKQLTLAFNLDSKLPPFVIGDKIRLHRIALELIGNALNFTDSGHVMIDVLCAKKEAQQLVIKITVNDTGMGIPKDKQEEIYLQFKRLTPSYQGIYKGAGLGLYIVKQFIDELDGEIYVESELGKGTRFTCIIPLKIPLIEDDLGLDAFETEEIIIANEATAVLREDLAPETPVEATISVLVVEDNVIAQKMAEALLSTMSCKVDTAMNGEQAIQRFAQGTYDLIFMDIGLGAGMDGTEVTQFIRKQEKGKFIPIVALTAHGSDENKQRCIESGMNAVLTKPLTVAHAEDVLKAFIPERRPKPPVVVKPLRPDLPDDEDLFRLEEFPLFDMQAALMYSGSEAVVLELLDLLINQELPVDLKTMHEAFANKDYPKVEETAHRIKGGAAYIGTIRMKYACQYLERYWKAGERQLFEKLYVQALQVIEETTTYIIDFMKEKS